MKAKTKVGLALVGGILAGGWILGQIAEGAAKGFGGRKGAKDAAKAFGEGLGLGLSEPLQEVWTAWLDAYEVSMSAAKRAKRALMAAGEAGLGIWLEIYDPLHLIHEGTRQSEETGEGGSYGEESEEG